MSLPILYKKNANGKTQQWSIRAEGDCIISEYGLVGGKIQTTKRICKDTNKGRSNARNPEQQAVFESQSKWREQKEKNLYSESKPTDNLSVDVETLGVETLGEEFKKNLSINNDQDLNKENKEELRVTPMLAETFSKVKKLPSSIVTQVKLDGVRAILHIKNDKISCTSRNNKEYPFLYKIKQESEKIIKLISDEIGSPCALDGEIYNHSLKFQKITSIVRKSTSPDPLEEELGFWVFDLITTKPIVYEDRWKLLNKYLTSPSLENLSHCKDTLFLLPYRIVNSEPDIHKDHDEYYNLGYEGVIIRNLKGLYQNKRSKDIIKLKKFFDDEAEIVGAEESEGTEKGCVVWKVKDREGNIFSLRPRGDRETRRQHLIDKDKYIGKQITYRYQEKTNDGIPRFPVGIGFRDYE